MIVKIRAEKRGGHVHATVFTAKSADQTYASSGTLVFREEEWPVIRAAFGRMGNRNARPGDVQAVRFEERGFEKPEFGRWTCPKCGWTDTPPFRYREGLTCRSAENDCGVELVHTDE